MQCWDYDVIASLVEFQTTPEASAAAAAAASSLSAE